MSNGISIQDILAIIAPTKKADITGTGAALLSQGQFNAVASNTAILSDAGFHKLRVNCILANFFGKVDPNSILAIAVNAGAVPINVVSVTTGTLRGHSITLTTSPTGIIYVSPDASGVVLVDITLNAAKIGTLVDLQHRNFCRGASIDIA